MSDSRKIDGRSIPPWFKSYGGAIGGIFFTLKFSLNGYGLHSQFSTDTASARHLFQPVANNLTNPYSFSPQTAFVSL